MKAKYRLHATRVDRLAVVDRPAVPDAEIVIFKRHEKAGVVLDKGTVPFQELPLCANDKSWNKDEAMKRVQKWADSPKDVKDWSKFRNAFMWYNEKMPENITSYKLPFADIVDGELKAVPKAVIEVVLKTTGTEIPLEDKKKVLNHCKQYYEKMDIKFPEIILKSIEVVDFNARFVIKSTEAAVDVLEDSFWEPLRYQTDVTPDEREKFWTELFDSFKEVVFNVLKRVAKKIKARDDVQRLTTEEVVTSFNQHLKAVAVSEAFLFLRCNLSSVILGHKRLENPDDVLKQVIEKFQGFVTGVGTQIVEKKLEVPEVTEKAGKKISAARLKKLVDSLKAMESALIAIQSIVAEQDDSSDKNKSKEAEDMELDDILKQLKTISADIESIKGLVPRIDSIEAVLKEQKMLLTPEEKVKAAEDKVIADKKIADDKVIADKKIADDKVEAEKKDLVKRRKDLGLKEDVEKEEVEKKEKEIAEGKAEFEKNLPKTIEEISKFINTIGARFGVKTSLSKGEEESKDKGSEDPFGEALKNKKKE